jgi:predicted TPR repeat methyltransferase
MKTLAELETSLRALVVDRPRQYFTDVRAKLQNLPRTNFELGCDFADQGQWKDATFRFKVALYLQPNFPQARYNLGCCYLRMGQKAKARQEFLQVLRQVPTHQDAIFMLSALDPNAVPAAQRPQRMPSEMVRQFFASVAPQYDVLEAQNNYQGARIAYDLLKPFVGEKKELTVVDLGCGTGLTARPWRALAKDVVGVDFVPEMAAAARLVRVADTPLFDRVLEEDILAASETQAPLASADLVLLVNVAQFLGNLQPLFSLLSAKLKPGALVVVTVEPLQAPSGYGLNIDTGRFGHHPEYVKHAAKEVGLQLKQESRAALYPNLAAYAYVLGK